MAFDNLQFFSLGIYSSVPGNGKGRTILVVVNIDIIFALSVSFFFLIGKSLTKNRQSQSNHETANKYMYEVVESSGSQFLSL